MSHIVTFWKTVSYTCKPYSNSKAVETHMIVDIHALHNYPHRTGIYLNKLFCILLALGCCCAGLDAEERCEAICTPLDLSYTWVTRP